MATRCRQYLVEQGGFWADYARAISMAVVVIGMSYLSLILGELVPKRMALIHPERIAAALAPLHARHGADRRAARMAPERDDRPDPAPVAGARRAARGDRRGDRLHAARGGGGRPYPAGRDRDRRDGAAARRPPDQRGDDAAHADRISRSRRSRRRIRRQIRNSSYSRFPVVHGGMDQLAGIVQVKDLLAACLAGEPFDREPALQPPLFLPNTVSVLRALEMFKSSGEPMALVVDEYGDLEGLVTLTDILEALVGDIPEIGDTDQRIVRREDGTWLIDGMVSLDELKQLLGVAAPAGRGPGVSYPGRLSDGAAHRVPKVADRVTAGGYLFEIVDMDGRRVDRVLIMPASSQIKQE